MSSPAAAAAAAAGAGGSAPAADRASPTLEIDVTFGAPAAVVRGADGVFSIDGSVLEGGGQILRNSVALSALLGVGVRISRIRASRPKPGLKAQHLSGISAIAEMYRAQLLGAALNSSEIAFTPRGFTPGQYLMDIKTAGSVALVIQAALPCMLFGAANSELKILGGTNVSMAPQVDYLMHVFQPHAARMGLVFEIFLRRRGHFPKGGGEVLLRVPAALPDFAVSPILLPKRGSVLAVRVVVYHSGTMPEHVATRVLSGARDALAAGLAERGLALVSVTSELVNGGPARDGSAGCLITATTSKGCLLAGTSLLEPRQAPQASGAAAAAELLANLDHGGCVDEYTQDQLIIFMALAEGHSSILTGPLSMHTKTSICIATGLTGAKFTCTSTERGAVISCDGIGFRAKPVAALSTA